MAEIKSTIDLIMERTKNLTMTAEEKRELRHRELTEKAKGWVVRYQDGVLGLEALQEEMKQEDEEPETLKKTLRTAILEMLDPEQDQERLFLLLSEVLHVEEPALTGALADYRTRKKDLLEKEAARFLAELKESGIGGSALTVNPNKVRGDQAAGEALKGEYRQQIARLMNGSIA